MDVLFDGALTGRRVLVTGHTGFKGSWLTLWLKSLGSHVTGFSLPQAPTVPCLYDLAAVGEGIVDLRGDLRDFDAIREAVESTRPELVIHLGAQTTIIDSYRDPKASFDINAGGTVNLLEAVRQVGDVAAMVSCATDKVYENREWVWGYRETDQLGGHDPYSAGKAMAELAVAAYRRSYFACRRRPTLLGSVRAGNVIGGGDFTSNGLVADAMRAAVTGEPVVLRNPTSTRPWQFVLEPLSGYLALAARLLAGEREFADAWNFGPLQHGAVSTVEVARRLSGLWQNGGGAVIKVEERPDSGAGHEAVRLALNWDKAALQLGWRPVYDLDEALRETAHWFRARDLGEDLAEHSRLTLDRYVATAVARGLPWAGRGGETGW